MPYSKLSKSPEEQVAFFNSLKTARDVAALLEIDYSRLVYHLYKVAPDKKYETFNIRKRNLGGVREINAPVTALKIIQGKLAEVLLNVYTPKQSVYSYVRNKNIVLNAKKHRKARYVLSIDLEDFFPSINFGRVRGLFMSHRYGLPPEVATVLAQICCHKNVLPQGAPTSPIVSNMICAQMDVQLQALAGRHKCYYTRYADDITISTSLKEFPSELAISKSILTIEIGDALEAVIAGNGFRINKRKTRLQPRYRRQEVTGVVVNEKTNVRWRYIREIRAMLNAWKVYGITDAEKEFFRFYSDKHRNPKLGLPSFRQIVKGRISFVGMVKGKDDKIFLRLVREYWSLYARDRGVPRLEIDILEEISRPQLFVEGKTDKSILNTAWRKLFGGAPMPFVIAVADSNPNSKKGGAAGEGKVALWLNAHRAEARFVAVGLFDRDEAGKRAYRDGLHAEFSEDADNEWKLDSERKAGSMVLPIPAGREAFDHYDNICIEYFFSDAVLSKKTEKGFGVTFDFPPLVVRGKQLPKEQQVEIAEARRINDGGKVVFAEQIVPSLDAAEFEAFRALFEKIVRLINVLRS